MSQPSDRSTTIASLDQPALATLTREWLLHGHLQDRVGIPLLYQYGLDREQAQEVAIDEWMAASPIYSIRTQELLGFRGDTVDVMLKNLQFDIGAPPQFMDFRLQYIDPSHAEFWLDHCGALMDVEPMGEEWVHGMCHTIEDPTFDATALATNPHAMVRPVHRPPRAPADRMPHCHWTITIDETHPTPEPHPNLALVEASKAATAPVAEIGELAGDGMADYSGEVRPDLRFEDLDRSVLLALLEEVATQSQLLMRAYLLSVSQRTTPEIAAEIGPRVLTGIGPVTAGRLASALGVVGDGLDAVATVLMVHPSFQPPGYVEPRLTRDRDRMRFALAPSDIFEEGDDWHWMAGLGQRDDRALDAIVRAVAPTARAVVVPAAEGEAVAYEITLDPSAPERVDEAETSLARFSTAAAFEFR